MASGYFNIFADSPASTNNYYYREAVLDKLDFSFTGSNFNHSFFTAPIDYTPNTLTIKGNYIVSDVAPFTTYLTLRYDGLFLGIKLLPYSPTTSSFNLNINLSDAQKNRINSYRKQVKNNYFTINIINTGTSIADSQFSDLEINWTADDSTIFQNYIDLVNPELKDYHINFGSGTPQTFNEQSILKTNFSGIVNEPFDRVAKATVRVNASSTNNEETKLSVYFINRFLSDEYKTISNQKGEVFAHGTSNKISTSGYQSYDIDLAFVGRQEISSSLNPSGIFLHREGRDHLSLFRNSDVYLTGCSSGLEITDISLYLKDFNDKYVPFCTKGSTLDDSKLIVYPSGQATSYGLLKKEYFTSGSGSIWNILDEDFETWGGTFPATNAPNGWNRSTFIAANYIDELSGKININTDGSWTYIEKPTLLGSGVEYVAELDITTLSYGNLRLYFGSGYEEFTTSGLKVFNFTATGPELRLTHQTGVATYYTVDHLRIREAIIPEQDPYSKFEKYYFDFRNNSALSLKQDNLIESYINTSILKQITVDNNDIYIDSTLFTTDLTEIYINLDSINPSWILYDFFWDDYGIWIDSEFWLEQSSILSELNNNPSITNYFSSNLDYNFYGENNLYNSTSGYLKVLSGFDLSSDFTLGFRGFNNEDGICFSNSDVFYLEKDTNNINFKIKNVTENFETLSFSHISDDVNVIVTRVGSGYSLYSLSSGFNLKSFKYIDTKPPYNNETFIYPYIDGYLCNLGLSMSGWQESYVKNYYEDFFDFDNFFFLDKVSVTIPPFSGVKNIPLYLGSDYSIEDRNILFNSLKMPETIDYNTHITSGYYVDLITSSDRPAIYSGTFNYKETEYIKFYGNVPSGTEVVTRIYANEASNRSLTEDDYNDFSQYADIFVEGTSGSGYFSLHGTSLGLDIWEGVNQKEDTIDFYLENWFRDKSFDLATKGHMNFNSGINFHTYGGTYVDDSFNMYMSGSTPAVSQLNFYLQNIGASSNIFNMYMSGYYSEEEKVLDLYTNGAYYSISGIDFETKGKSSSVYDLPMNTFGKVPVLSSGSLDFYNKGSNFPELVGRTDFVTFSNMHPDNSINLFIKSDILPINSSIPFHLQCDLVRSGIVDMVLYNNNQQKIRSVNMYVKVPGNIITGSGSGGDSLYEEFFFPPYFSEFFGDGGDDNVNPGYIPFIIGRDHESVDHRLNFYLNVNNLNNSGVDFYSRGANMSYSGIYLYMSGYERTVENIKLYTHGF